MMLHEHITFYYLVYLIYVVIKLPEALIKDFEIILLPNSNKYLNHGTLIE